MNEDELQSRLGAVDLFQGLSKRSLKRLVQSGKEVEHAAGHEVTGEGKNAAGFHLVLDGSATVSTGGAVRRTLRAGEHFGEISLIDGKPRSASVVADGPLRTFSISSGVFSPLLDDAAFSRSLLLVLCSRLRDVESR